MSFAMELFHPGKTGYRVTIGRKSESTTAYEIQ